MTQPRRFVAVEDLRVLSKLIAGYLATSVLPPRLDPWLVPKLLEWKVPATLRQPGPWMTEVERRIRFTLESLVPDLDFRAQSARFNELCVETDWLTARALHRKPLQVTTSVDGLERLSAGNVILWGMSFCGTLMVKVALARAGVPLVHLSGAGHGGADPPTTLGLKLVSPIYCVSENRFLAERVVIPMDESLGYLRTLMARLEQGAVVYIAGERLATRANTTVPCLGRPTAFARGAPGLAYEMSSALLPVAVFRNATLDYRVVIEEPIQVDPALPRNEWIERAIAQFAERVTRNVLAHPSDWDWYRHQVPSWEAASQKGARTSRTG